MKLKTCEYCGTEYSSDLPKCPLCGKSGAGASETERRESSCGGSRLASHGAKPEKNKKQRNEDRVPSWMWAVICTVLALAVFVGALYFVYCMGFLDRKEKPQEPPAQTEQLPPQEDQQPDAPEVPEDVQKPVDPDQVLCTSLTLSQTAVVMDEEGGRIFLTAVALPTDCTEEIVFASSDESVVTVDQSGMLTAIAPGEADIIVSCGSKSKTCSVLCEFEPAAPVEPEVPTVPAEPEPPVEPEPEPEPEKMPTLSSVDFTLFHPGEQTTLKVKDAPEGASITYTSSNPGVATVTDTGLVTAVGSGNSTITVMVGDTKLTCIARCNLEDSTENNNGGSEEVPGSYTISHADVTLFHADERFTITLFNDQGTEIVGEGWTSSDSSVCTVNADGRVVAVGKGTATVSTTYGGKTYECIVRCNF